MASTTTSSTKHSGIIKDTTHYSNCKHGIYKEINNLVTSAKRFQWIHERKEESVFDLNLIKNVCKGKYTTRWRGISMMKDCLDKEIYEQMLWEVKPQSIFETGAYTGASALWLSDMMNIYGLPVHIYSIDINLDLVDPLVLGNKNITIKEGDATKISQAFSKEFLETCPHPWIISEDCHVDVVGVMEYFHKYMEVGDYFIIEDTSPDSPLKSGHGLLEEQYEKWGDKKLKLMKEFLLNYKEYYKVDTFYTDFYGYNGTFNWDGYIKRIK